MPLFPFSCSTGSISSPGAASTSTTAFMRFQGNSYSGNLLGDTILEQSQWGYSVATENTQNDGTSTSPSDSWNSTVGAMIADVTVKFRAKAVGRATALGKVKTKRSSSVAPSASTPTASDITSTTATIACNYFPNVNESSCSAQLQYKKTTDSIWTNAGSANTTGGYSEVTSHSAAITGLTSSTQYQVRLVITRTTQNDTSLTSSVASFTTLAGTPAITTDAATSVSSTGATLNSTFDINDGTGCTVYYWYDTISPPTSGTQTAGTAVTADGSVPEAISSLSASTLYYFQAFASFTTPSGSPVSGSILSFTTSANPAADAAAQEHTAVFQYDRTFGKATSVYFTVMPIGSDNKFYTGTAPWARTDVRLYADGGSFENPTTQTTPSQVSGPLYKLDLTSKELECDDLYIYIRDNTQTVVRDVFIKIRTHLQLGSIDIDAATGTKANTTALKLTGYGSGHGLSVTGGATGKDIDGILGEMVTRSATAQAGGGATTIKLDASASTTNDYYNGSIIFIKGGTGAGQARVITDYVGSTLLATVNKAWSTNPTSGSEFVIIGGNEMWKTIAKATASGGAQLDELPTFASHYADLLQYIFQRITYARKQTLVVRTMYQANGTTGLAQQGVDNDGSTENVETAVSLL